MNSEDKTKEQLINELLEMRQRIAELEALAGDRQQAEAEKERLLAAEREQRLLAETLAEVTLALTSQVSNAAVLDEILCQVQRLVPYKTANIVLLENDTLHIARWQGYQAYGAEQLVSNLVQPLADIPLDVEAVQSREPVVIPDTHQDPRWVAFEETAWIRSYLVVPICLHDRVLGLLRLDGNLPGEFSVEDAERLQPLANAAAIALENARLYERARQEIAERERAEETLARRAHEMAALYETSLEINTQPNLSALLQAIVRRAAELLGTQMGGLFLLRPDGETLELVVSHNQPSDYLGAKLRLGEGLSGRIIQTGEPMKVEDYRHWQGRADSLADPIGRILGVPLTQGDRAIGVLNVFDADAGSFSEDDVQLLRLFAAQAATALEKARLFDEIRHRAEQLEALRQVSQDLAALHDLDTLLSQIIERAIQLLGGQAGGIYLYRPERDVLEWAVAVGTVHWLSATLRRGEGLSGKVWATGKPVIVDDYQRWSGKAQKLSAPPASAVVGVPIQWGDEFLGVINIGTTNAQRPFTAENATLLSQFADQAAIAIRNARFYAEIQRRLEEQIALREAGAVISSTLDLADVLSHIAERMSRTVDTTSAYICSYDPETTTSTVLAEYVDPQANAQEQVSDLGAVYYLPRDFPGTVEFLQTGQPGMTHLDDPDLPEAERVHLQQYGAQTTLVIPLKIGGQTVAYAELWESRRQRDFTVEEIALCQAIAQQAAIAIENARLHQETQRQARQVQQILDTVQEGILLLDARHCVKLANPMAQVHLAVLAGVGVGEVLTHLGGQPLAEILALANDDDWHEVTSADPGQRVFELAVRPMTAESEAEGWVMVLRDVTEERKNQERVQQQNRLAAVGQLAAGIAHDFNNILTSVIGYAELIRLDPNLSEIARADLGRVVEQGQRGAHLIRQVLDFSRQSLAERQALDLVPFVKEVIQLLERTLPENIRLSLKIEPDCKICQLKADPTQIQQALTNLAVNARDAMPEGGVLQFRLSSLLLSPGEQPPCPDMPPGSWIALSVSDTGTGISPELHPRLFEPFFTTKEVGQGTGLGLAQVYGIVKQHDGYVDVESQVGKGATFTLYLPALPPSNKIPLQMAAAELPRGQGQVILLVEDNPTVLEVNKSMLEHLGYQVLMATNGREALEVYDQYQAEIALVLTDITMPEIGGIALSQALRERSSVIKVVALTGYPLEAEAKDLLVQGIVAWLQKPLNLTQLGQAVSRLLQA